MTAADFDWDPDAGYDPYDDPDYDEDSDPWVWRPVVKVELPPMPGEEP